MCGCFQVFMNVYYTFLPCLRVSTITRILEFFMSTFIVWNSPLRFNRGFLYSLLLRCKKNIRSIFSNKVKLISDSIENAARGYYYHWSTHLSWSKESKGISLSQVTILSPTTFSQWIFLLFFKKSSIFICISLLLTTSFGLPALYR